MDRYIGLIAVALIVLMFAIINVLREKAFMKNSVNYLKRVDAFYAVFKNDYIPNSEMIRIKKDFNDLYKSLQSARIPRSFPFKEIINKFEKDFNDLVGFVYEHNKVFVKEEINRCSSFLSNIDGRSLDQQQREAVVTDEDHNLVIAGAGAGKTLTISGKVKYLCQIRNVAPEDILLITYTRKAAQEMTDRIGRTINHGIQATTFHKFGLDILKESTGKVFDIKDDISQLLDDFFSERINEHKNVFSDLVEYFAYYLQLPADLKDFESLGEAYEHEKSMDLETVKSKYSVATYSKKYADANAEKLKTLNKERVKSLQEVLIANFLFLHGVKYEYERPYPYQEDNQNRRLYKPDFYLPEYDIYLEHFGVNKENRVPQYSEVEEEKYIQDMLWKRECHLSHKTKLLETYSWYFSDGILLEKLEEMLLNNGVSFREVDLEELFESVYMTQGEKYFSQFKTLCSTFINLFKSGGYKLEDLDGLDYKSEVYKNNFFSKRLAVFKNIVRILIDEYEKDLRRNNAYDFSDMINLATDTVNNGFRVHPYKYVIIDEYQDTSIARYRLVKAVLNQTGARLFCVGDDWQSIYRFAGSDISLFTSFEEYFGYTKMMYIENTYRNSQQLIDEAGTFIMKNPNQIKKQLHSNKDIVYPIVLYYTANITDSLKKTMDIILERDKMGSVLLLGRTKYDYEIIKESDLFYGKKSDELHYRFSPETPVSFLTVHKAKGLEADNVILLNFNNSLLGFPNKIADDPMLEVVLSKSDEFLYAEERRLLYVALTRTKNRVYVLVDEANPSEFINDLQQSNNILYLGKEMTLRSGDTPCPRCKTGHLVKRKNAQTGQEFYGCTNYPKCDYTVQATNAVKNKTICPRCGGFLKLKPGRFGAFYGCSNYPHCRYTKEYTEVKCCPKCGSSLKLRDGKYGVFWGCSNYPECDYKEECIE
ncbi:MAG: UvrD-helicase domain-containing protein [Erysipelotrichaceae bacterium]|nr:UvrD-helicase domain-containing protein [Erysipelotrichaceae bacterium]